MRGEVNTSRAKSCKSDYLTRFRVYLLALFIMDSHILSSIFGALFFSVTLVNAGANFETGDSFEAEVYIEVNNPRGLFVDGVGDILVVSESSDIISLTETSTGDVTQNVVVNGAGLGLNHGIAVHGGNIYASSETKVYAWSYVAGNRSLIPADPVTVVENIPTGGHKTRTLIFDSESRLYVSKGSANNVDEDSTQSIIRRFDFSQGFPQTPYGFQDGEVRFRLENPRDYCSGLILRISCLGFCGWTSKRGRS